MADLGTKEVEKIKFAFSIYDTECKNSIDACILGDLLRACDLNPTNALIEKMGGTKKKGEKTFSFEEVLPIYSQVKNDKDQGVYEDFVECLKQYDKQEDGKMLGAELTHILLAIGEKLSEEEVEEITKDCMDPEDEDGLIPYVPFIQKFMVQLKDILKPKYTYLLGGDGEQSDDPVSNPH